MPIARVRTALERHNERVMREASEANRTARADTRRRIAENLAEVGAEYIHRASNSTKTVKLEDIMRYHHPNE